MKKYTIFLMLMLFVSSSCMMSCIDADDLISNVVEEEDDEIVDEDGDGIPDDAVEEEEEEEEEEDYNALLYKGYVNEAGEYILASFAGGFIPEDSDEWIVNCAVIDGLATTDDYAYLRSALLTLAEEGDRLITLTLTEAYEIPEYALCGEYEFSEGQPYVTTETALISVTADDVTSIGDYAFLASNNLEYISFDAATDLGEGSFMVCKALVDFELPKVETLGKWAFAYDEYLELDDQSLPEALTLGQGVFYLCRSITTAPLAKLTTLGYTAFSNCGGLANVSMPSLESIGEEGFRECTSLVEITLPKVISIGDSAFKYCSNLTTATFRSATALGSGSPKEGSQIFGYCENLIYLTFAVEGDGTLTALGGYMFYTPEDLDGESTSIDGREGDVNIYIGQAAYDNYCTDGSTILDCSATIGRSYTFKSITVVQ